MGVISQLLVNLTANTGGLDSALQRSGQKVSQFADMTTSSAKSVGGGFGGIGLAAGVGLGTLGAAAIAAGSALVGLGLHQQTVIEENKHLADQLGLTYNALAGMQHAGEMAGVGAEGMSTALRHFQKELSEANHGSAEANKTFASLNLSAQQLSKLPLEEAFAQASGAANNLSNSSDKVATSMKLAGREGLAAVNAFKNGTGDLAKFNQEAKDLGLTMSKEGVEAVEKSNQAWRRMSGSIAGIGNTMAVYLAPIIEKGSDLFTALFKEVNKGLQSAKPSMDSFVSGITTGIKSVTFTVENWRDILTLSVDKVWYGFSRFNSNISNAFMTLLPQVFTSFGNFMEKFFENLGKNISENWQQIWESIQSGGKSGGKFVWHNLSEGLEDAMREIGKKSTAPLTEYQKQLGEKIKGEENKLKARWNDFNKEVNKEDGKNGKGLGATNTVNKGVALAEMGSQEAFKILAGNRDGDKMYAKANEQLKEAREHNKRLDKILTKLDKGTVLAPARL